MKLSTEGKVRILAIVSEWLDSDEAKGALDQLAEARAQWADSFPERVLAVQTLIDDSVEDESTPLLEEVEPVEAPKSLSIITKTVREEIEKEVIIDILCNVCGKSCKPINAGDQIDFYGLIRAHVSTGYYSSALPDFTNYEFSVCEPCLKQLMDSFKIPVHATHYM